MLNRNCSTPSRRPQPAGRRRTGARLLGVTLFAAVLSLAACSSGGDGQAASGTSGTAAQGSSAGAVGDSGQSAGASGNFKIGFIQPDDDSSRYTTTDVPAFKAQLVKDCPGCKFLFADSGGDASKQRQQAESMIAQGAKVIVMDPVDSVAAASITAAAKRANVKMIAYDRSIKSKDQSYFVGVDWPQVGVVQATSLTEKLKADGVDPNSNRGIIVIWGDLQSEAGFGTRQGALPILKASGYKILAETNTWDGPTTQQFVSSQISKLRNRIAGVFAGNDTDAGGAISAYKAANAKPIPPITGLDATLAGLQQVIAGNQYMTTYNDFKTEGRMAADAAVKLARGEAVTAPIVDGVPTDRIHPIAVTVDKIQELIIDKGVYTYEKICTPQYEAACKAAGLSKP